MSRATTKQVRAIIAKHYPNWLATYNDIRKNKKTRRIKCMRNGYRETPEFYKNAAAAIRADLKAAGIWNRDDGFKTGETWRGDYVYYSVVVEA